MNDPLDYFTAAVLVIVVLLVLSSVGRVVLRMFGVAV